MRLKTKLVLSATALTFAIVLVLCSLFMGQLLRQRIEQTAASNDVLAHQVLLMTRQAVETGMRENPPVDRSDEALHAAVVDALRSSDALTDVMNAVVRYSPTVQDVSVTDAHGLTLVSTDPDSLNQRGYFSDEPEEGARQRICRPDARAVWEAAGAGPDAVAGPEWSAVSGGACGGAVDVSAEFV